jgi:hypothetical protein
VVEGNNLRDLVTGLVWRPATVAGKNFDGALAVCNGLPEGPWRLPKRIELVTLLDFGRGASLPLIDAQFSGVNKVKVWTSSALLPLSGPSPSAYWSVDFDTGVVKPKDATASDVADVLCVRAKR